MREVVAAIAAIRISGALPTMVGWLWCSLTQKRLYRQIQATVEDLAVIQRINDDYAEMTAQLRAAMQGITLPEDRAKLLLLEREKRADLAALVLAQATDLSHIGDRKSVV